jgi:co-chaperonin GroES (HSP10)
MIKATAKRLIAIPIVEKLEKGKLIFTAEPETFNAVIIAKGEEVTKNIDINDVVILKRMSGFPFEVGQTKMLSIVEQEIIAIIPGNGVQETMEHDGTA